MKKNIKECHPNWPQFFYHVYRILIIGGFGSGKTNALLNLMKQPYDHDDDELFL